MGCDVRDMVLQVSSKAMVKASHLWGPLKLAPIKMIFEGADVEAEAGRASKRPRR